MKRKKIILKKTLSRFQDPLRSEVNNNNKKLIHNNISKKYNFESINLKKKLILRFKKKTEKNS